jgi:hypothetical protein
MAGNGVASFSGYTMINATQRTESTCFAALAFSIQMPPAFTQMPTSGPTHERAAGERGDQASHRRHCEGQAAGEEGVIEKVGESAQEATATVWIEVGSRATKVVIGVSEKR